MGRFGPLALAFLFALPLFGAAPERTWRTVPEWYGDSFTASDSDLFAGWTQQSELRFREGDDLAWASPRYDDSGWKVVDRRSALRKNTGIFWLRFRVRSIDPAKSIPSGFFLGETAACEMYWDGRLVRRFGRPGPDRRHETPGPVYSLFDLPPSSVGPGEHVVALRLSTYWFNRPEPTMDIWVGNVVMGDVVRVHLQRMLVPLLGVGALFFFGLAAGVFWLTTGRPRGVLLFAGLNLGGAFSLFSVHVRNLFSFPYSISYPVWTATEVVVALTATCLLALVVVQFGLPRQRWIVGGFAAFEIADGIRQSLAYHMIEPIKMMVDSWKVVFPCSFALLVWALFRRRRDAAYVLVGVAFAGAWYEHDPEEFLWDHFFPGMLPLLLGFLLVIALQVRTERRQAREAKLTAARLELELLRKTLQPHFLMNTLTALAQAIEENPRSATRLIDDLAGELRELAQFAEFKEVPLHREIELCRAHLRVMSVRTEKPWRLEVEGDALEATVPPALFFTLIENGFTHQQPIGGATTFRLRSEAVADGRRYVFFSPGNIRQDDGAPRTSGSGLRYVKARLDESWLGRWAFGHGPVAGGWETTITLRRRPGGEGR